MSLLSLIAITVAFQNCNPKVSHSSQATLALEGGNGNGYDCKTYINVRTGNACPDGSYVNTEIKVYTDGRIHLMRDNCNDYSAAPQSLSPSQISFSAAQPAILKYGPLSLGESDPAQPPTLICGQVGMNSVSPEQGFNYIAYPFPGDGDIMSDGTRSKLILLEDGAPLGPAHAQHQDIRDKGHGLFSHWGGYGTPGTVYALYFSASDNSNPITNGRVYTYGVSGGACPQ